MKPNAPPSPPPARPAAARRPAEQQPSPPTELSQRFEFWLNAPVSGERDDDAGVSGLLTSKRWLDAEPSSELLGDELADRLEAGLPQRFSLEAKGLGVIDVQVAQHGAAALSLHLDADSERSRRWLDARRRRLSERVGERLGRAIDVTVAL